MTLVILILAFGALLAAAVPVLLAVTSVAAALGLSALVSHLLPVTETTASVVLLIGMAVGVDYSLFYVRRAREERAAGRTALDAVEIAAATSGRAVVVSGGTVAVAMAGMFLTGSAIFSSLAVGAILVVAVAVLGSVTVLPAILATLGRWVDRPRVPFLHRLTMRPGRESRLWSAILRPTLRHPAVALAIGVIALLALAAPATAMRTSLPGINDLPRSIPVLQSYDRLTAAFPSEGAAHVVAVEAPADQSDDVRAALLDLADRAAATLCSPRPTSQTSRCQLTGGSACSRLPSPTARSRRPPANRWWICGPRWCRTRSERYPRQMLPSAAAPQRRWTSPTCSVRGCRG